MLQQSPPGSSLAQLLASLQRPGYVAQPQFPGVQQNAPTMPSAGGGSEGSAMPLPGDAGFSPARLDYFSRMLGQQAPRGGGPGAALADMVGKLVAGWQVGKQRRAGEKFQGMRDESLAGVYSRLYGRPLTAVDVSAARSDPMIREGWAAEAEIAREREAAEAEARREAEYAAALEERQRQSRIATMLSMDVPAHLIGPAADNDEGYAAVLDAYGPQAPRQPGELRFDEAGNVIPFSDAERAAVEEAAALRRPTTSVNNFLGDNSTDMERSKETWDLQKDYDAAVETPMAAVNTFGMMAQLAAIGEGPADDLLFTMFQKMGDKLSVVRESEHLRTSRSAGLIENLASWVTRAAGEGYTPETRAGIMRAAGALAEEYMDQIRRVRARRGAVLERNGIDPEYIMGPMPELPVYQPGTDVSGLVDTMLAVPGAVAESMAGELPSGAPAAVSPPPASVPEPAEEERVVPLRNPQTGQVEEIIIDGPGILQGLFGRGWRMP